MPRGTEPADVTLEEAVRLLAEREAKGGGKKPARGKAVAKPKAMTKNVVAKKPAAKKKAPAKKKVAKV